MSIVVYCENIDGNLKKATLEALTYAHKMGSELGLPTCAVTTGNPSLDVLKSYGVSKYVEVSPNVPADSSLLAGSISLGFDKLNGQYLILPFNSTGKSIAGQLAVKCDAGIVSSVNALPESLEPLRVSQSLFAGKASAVVQVNTTKVVLALQSNAIQPEEKPAGEISGEMLMIDGLSEVELVKQEMLSEGIPLPEAELVVSGGRGFKGPENWHILEDLAKVLGAATACSRPVSDSDWRPHHEHVGQTGIAISPNLYIAIGISGAIQHLGGVNNSKTIVVINNDPEAPFFKAADYGVIGDLFEVVPKLTAAFQAFKAQQ